MSRAFSVSIYNDLLKSIRRSGSGAKDLSLFLDFDGTLTEVAGHPDDASLSDSMRDTLISLSSNNRVVIISGRGIHDLKEKVAIKGLTYVGNHGMEMSAGDFSFIYDIGPVESEAIKEVAGLVLRLISSYGGVVLEEKGLTLSIHYRCVREAEKPRLLRGLDRVLKPFSVDGLIKKTFGKGLVEIRPTADWDKGSAVAWLMERSGFRSTIPICVGDDETDEDAFRVVRGRGLSIFVGKRKSIADLYIPGQNGVEAFLAFLASREGRGRA